MPQQDRAIATRASIVLGAATVFNGRGYANASLDLIADEAKVTRGALYFHFKSKEELANAVIEEQHRISRGYADQALAPGCGALEALVRMTVGLAQQLRTEIVVSAGIRLTTDGTAGELSARDPYLDWMRVVASLTRDAIDQGDIRSTVDACRFARFLISTFTGLQLVSDALNHRNDLLERLRDMWGLLLPALVAPSPATPPEELLALIPG